MAYTAGLEHTSASVDADASKARSRMFGRSRVTLASILGQTSASRTRSQTMLAHQPLNAMQSDVQTFGQNVAP